jgi:hypothetical protein
MSDINNEHNKNENEDLSRVKVSGQGIFTGENKPDPAKLIIDFDEHEDLEIKHGVALIDFIQIVNKQFAENNTSHSDADSVQEILNDFVNEVDDLPRKKMNTFKREKVSAKVMALAEAVMNVLPHTEKTLAAFVPLAPFGELVGKNIEHIMKVKYGVA